jgi:16S rRNA (uracil1498-N3)-methyltransferase
MITLFAEGETFAEGGSVTLHGDAAWHARVRRVRPGSTVVLLDGVGHLAKGKLVAVAKEKATVEVERVHTVPKPMPLEVIVPVADRDRMLLAAEKCVELQITAWRPAHFARSRSVAPRGEGSKFRQKVRARMLAALEQSGSAWLPVIEPETPALEALRSIPESWSRLLMDATGQPILHVAANAPTAIAVGPEGGFDPDESAKAIAAGWVPASLANTTLRFETALIAAASVIRATQLTHRS